jgi:hypothetical protein
VRRREYGGAHIDYIQKRCYYYGVQLDQNWKYHFSPFEMFETRTCPAQTGWLCAVGAFACGPVFQLGMGIYY